MDHDRRLPTVNIRMRSEMFARVVDTTSAAYALPSRHCGSTNEPGPPPPPPAPPDPTPTPPPEPVDPPAAPPDPPLPALPLPDDPVPAPAAPVVVPVDVVLADVVL